MNAHAELDFRQRLRAKVPLVGTMLKTPACQATEILSNVGFDFVVVDQEHSPFDRGTTDLILLAGRAVRIPVLVRVPAIEMALSACDGGANGVIVPHVASATYARSAAASCRYKGGSRGYATSTRAGGYSAASMGRHTRESDAKMTVIVQIEDLSGVEEIAAIAAVEGVDALFIGRNDLACAFGDDSADSPRVREAVEDIAAAARSAEKTLGVFVSSMAEIEWLKALGATLFIFSSDHGFLRVGAAQALSQARSILGA